MDFDIHSRICAQSEVQAGIVARIETTLTQHALGLCFPAVVNQNAGSNGASVGLNPVKLHLNPVGTPAYVIAQQGRRFVQVYDQNVDVTIVIEVPERTSPAAMRRGNPGAGSLDEFFKGLIAQIAENGAWSLVGVLPKLPLDLWVNVTGNHEQIRMTIVIQVNHSGTPTDKTGFNSNAGAPRNVVEIALTVIVVQNAGVVGKVGLE
jgi:hypothetical protein